MPRTPVSAPAVLSDVYTLEARSATRDLWLAPDFPGQPEFGAMRLPDGTDVYDLVARGDLGRLNFTPNFVKYGRGRRAGDLLWTGGLAIKIASQRFVDVLNAVNATGYTTFPVEISLGGELLPGYIGLAVPSVTDDTDLYSYTATPYYSFAAKRRVVSALQERGVTDLVITPLSPPPASRRPGQHTQERTRHRTQ